MKINHGLCRVQDASVHLISPHPLSPPFHLSSFCFSKMQWEFYPVAHTVYACEPTVQAKCMLKAVPIWKQTVCETTKGCASVSKGSQSRSALPSTAPLLLPFTLLLLHQTLLPPLLHAQPYFAHYITCKPPQSSASTLCRMLVYQLSPPPPGEKPITAAILLVCISVLVSLSQLSLSPCTQAQKLTYFFFSSLSFSTSFPLHLLKWSEHLSCIVRSGGQGAESPS